MKNKVYFILLLVSCSISLSIISATYSRYVAGTTENVNIKLARWQLLLNNQDITNETNSEIEITPIIEENQNVKKDYLAPSSKGYFDINIDASNVDVSYLYDLTINTDNEEINDLLVTKYAILPSTYVEGDVIEYKTITDGKITNEVLFDNEDESFKYEPFTIRVYFEWYDDGEETKVNNELEDFKIKVNMTFKQLV